MSYVPAKKNAAYVFYVGLVSQATPSILQANPTLAAGDVKVAIDDGAPANLATLPAVDADFTKRVKVSLSAAEMNGDNITIIFSDAAGDEWCDTIVNIQTSVRQVDDIPTSAEITAAVPTATAIVDEWEAQSQADPTGFHVNVMEIEGSDATDTLQDNALTKAIDGTVTAEQVLKAMLAFIGGITTGGGGTEIIFKNQAGDKDVITLSGLDANGNRASTTLDFS